MGVFTLFHVLNIDATPVSISDAAYITLIYYFLISVYKALPTIGGTKKSRGKK